MTTAITKFATYTKASRNLVLAGLGMAAASMVAAPAMAQSGPGYVDFTFRGTVEIKRDDSITLRNPDGSSTTIPSSEIPAYRFNQGDTLDTTFRVFTDNLSTANSACGGRFTLTFQGGPCTASARIITPFGEVGWNGDSGPRVSGLDVVRDPQSGEYRLDMPTGSYSMGFVGINPYHYNSGTGDLSSPTSTACVSNPYACGSNFTGNANGIYFGAIPVVGNFGQNPQGQNYGYNAGSAGIFSIVGNFLTGGGGNPTQVPEPGIALLFAGGAMALWMRRRKHKMA